MCNGTVGLTRVKTKPCNIVKYMYVIPDEDMYVLYNSLIFRSFRLYDDCSISWYKKNDAIVTQYTFDSLSASRQRQPVDARRFSYGDTTAGATVQVKSK